MENKSHALFVLIRHIPKGKVASYGRLADWVGLPGRARWVGRMLKTSNEPGLPWHRVVRADGQLAFPQASQAAAKQKALLAKEQVEVQNNRVKLNQVLWQPDLADLLFLLSE